MNRRGFTLLEVMIAMSIVAIGIVRCMQTFTASLSLQDRASRQTRAVLYARAAMDALLFEPEIRNRSRRCLDPSREGFVLCSEVRAAESGDGVDLRMFNEDSEFGLRYLKVDVAWEDGRGKKSYELKSLRVAPVPEDD
jgi:prepilin-type N-terminal cleavage/methylation domain-containing protein